MADVVKCSSPGSEGVRWARVNDEPFEYAIQQGPHGDEFVKLINGSCLRRSSAGIEHSTKQQASKILFGDPAWLYRPDMAEQMDDEFVDDSGSRSRKITPNQLIAELNAAASSTGDAAQAAPQSIETAPRDGTPILYWDENCAIPETVCWLDGSKIASHGWYPYAGGNWFVDAAREKGAVWWPLPKTPALSSTDRGGK